MPPNESRIENSHAEFLRRLERKRLPFVYRPSEGECSAFCAGLREMDFKRQNDADYRVGVCSSQGKRDKMEDFYSVDRIDLADGRPAQILGLYDGHGGRGCAQFVSTYMPRFIAQSTQANEDLSTALRNAYAVAESRWLESTPMDPSGTTSVSIVFCQGEMHVAHVGDSRAVLCRDGVAVRLTDDHKPDVGTEREAIMARGGVVTYPDRRTGRVDGNLAISRTLGDRQWKPHVSPEPDTSCHLISEDDEFVIIASDGLWDVLTDQAAVDAVKSMHSPGKMAKALVEQAFCKGSLDNITVVVALLRSAPPQPPTPQSALAGGCGTTSSSTSQSSKRSREKGERSAKSEQREKPVDSPTAAYIRKIGARASFKPDPEKPKKAAKAKSPPNPGSSLSKSSFACAPLDLRCLPTATPQQSHPALQAQNINTRAAELMVASRECTPPEKAAAKRSLETKSSEKKSAERKSAERRSGATSSAKNEHKKKKSPQAGGTNAKLTASKSISQVEQPAEVPDLATGIPAKTKSLQDGWTMPPFATAFSKADSLPHDAAQPAAERKASSTRKRAKEAARRSAAPSRPAAESPDARCQVSLKPKAATPELGGSCDSSPSEAIFSKRSASHTQRRGSTSDDPAEQKPTAPRGKSQAAGKGKLAQVVQPVNPQSGDSALDSTPPRKAPKAQAVKPRETPVAQPSAFARLFCCAGSSVEAGGPMDGY